MALCTPAVAATVTPVSGQVLVNAGTGYQRVTGPTEVGPGGSVVVNPGGGATVVYPDGCTVNVEPGAVVTIGEQSPCATAQQQQEQPGLGLNTTTLAIGAVAVGGGIAAIILSQKDKSASP
jgi:hypothetical protein